MASAYSSSLGPPFFHIREGNGQRRDDALTCGFLSRRFQRGIRFTLMKTKTSWALFYTQTGPKDAFVGGEARPILVHYRHCPVVRMRDREDFLEKAIVRMTH